MTAITTPNASTHRTVVAVSGTALVAAMLLLLLQLVQRLLQLAQVGWRRPRGRALVGRWNRVKGRRSRTKAFPPARSSMGVAVCFIGGGAYALWCDLHVRGRRDVAALPLRRGAASIAAHRYVVPAWRGLAQRGLAQRGQRVEAAAGVKGVPQVPQYRVKGQQLLQAPLRHAL